MGIKSLVWLIFLSLSIIAILFFKNAHASLTDFFVKTIKNIDILPSANKYQNKLVKGKVADSFMSLRRFFVLFFITHSIIISGEYKCRIIG